MLAIAGFGMLASADRVDAAARASVCGQAKAARVAALVSVPFRVVDGRIYVTAKVIGAGPFVFAVDTGASGMGRADASLVAALGLPVTGAGESSDGVATARVDTVRLSSIALGGLVRRDLEVSTRDYASKLTPEAAFAGILGREFFGDGLLVIDYPARRLSFTRAVALEGDGPDVLSYDRAFRVPVRIGDTLTEGNLDTGANVTFVLPQTLFDRVGGGAVAAAGEGQLTNTVVRTGKAVVKGPFRIGSAALSNVEVRVSDRYPELLVGAHVLQRFVLLIDQRSRRIALCP
jgi:predicted aspartyl protease